EDGKEETIKAKNVIIATGSKPFSLPSIKIDKKRIITSTEALTLKEVPEHLVLIGGGVIGLEFGSVYARLGSKVIVLEYADSIIPTMDKVLGKELQKSLKGLGFELLLGHKVTGASVRGKKVTVTAEDKQGKEVKVSGDYCLVAIGRIAYTDGLGLENIGITVDEKGKKVPVNEHLETR